jgi:hypothetical protein
VFIDSADIELAEIIDVLRIDKAVDKVWRRLVDAEMVLEATDIETGASINLAMDCGCVRVTNGEPDVWHPLRDTQMSS